jgi:hypothetical protein
MLFEHILFSMTPFSFCKHTTREISLELWSIYFWWVDGMFCVTPGVEVSLYLWVYVISIWEHEKILPRATIIWQNSMGHKKAYVQVLYFDIDIWLS